MCLLMTEILQEGAPGVFLTMKARSGHKILAVECDMTDLSVFLSFISICVAIDKVILSCLYEETFENLLVFHVFLIPGRYKIFFHTFPELQKFMSS